MASTLSLGVSLFLPVSSTLATRLSKSLTFPETLKGRFHDTGRSSMSYQMEKPKRNGQLTRSINSSPPFKFKVVQPLEECVEHLKEKAGRYPSVWYPGKLDVHAEPANETSYR